MLTPATMITTFGDTSKTYAPPWLVANVGEGPAGVGGAVVGTGGGGALVGTAEDQ
jgi:hypothetical protein